MLVQQFGRFDPLLLEYTIESDETCIYMVTFA